MPIDRTNNNTSRPLKPTLATTRTAKTPVTPRLAPSIASATSTPAVRTPRLAVGTTPRLNTAPQEDVTPAKGYAHSNVTPRSSSRKVRVGVNSAGSTPSVTPSGTPVHTRPASTVDYPQAGGLGVREAGAGPNKRPRSVAGNNSAISTPRLPLSGIYSHAPDAGATRGASVSPRFFHANDARASEPQPQSQPQPPPIKKAVFFHANGDLDATSRPSSVPSVHAESKFFHANSPPASRDSPSIVSPPSNSLSPEPPVNFQPSDGPHSLQPPSPTKENIHLSYRKGASQVMRPNLHRGQSALSILSGSHVPDDSNDGSKRHSSPASSTPRYSHAKSASLSSIDSAHSLKKIMSQESPHVAPSPLHNEKRVGSHSNSSFSDSVASAPSESIPALSNLPSPGPLSPNIPAPGQSMLEKMNELAANARRERKVLDLEISNNSLLAINRSLEKEVRKQKAEIRRFRRMSRAGQFSANTISHMEGFSAIGASDLGNLTDMSEEEEEEEEEPEPEEPEPEELSDSSFDESIMSDSALAERDQAHRLRDEKRLKLDLAKHQELIVDSQKMNQSLARCLGWTEELIKNGRKALAYQVRASDVQLGGRVLISDDQLQDEHDDEHHKDSRGLLSPWSPVHRAMNPMDPDSPPLAADRDSGIDIDGTKFQGFISPLASPL